MNSGCNIEPLIQKISLSEFKDIKKRTILIGDSENKKRINKFSNNKIRSTKYSLLSWLPKSIIMQFSRIANIYFLIISILNFFYFSPKNPISMVITFGVILLFTSIREGIEDYQRYKKDKKANEKKHVYYNDKNTESKGYEYKSSKKIHVGDILKIFKDQEFPADICLLKSSNRNGVCFIDTVNLDGESNLKDKKCNQKTQSYSDRDLCKISAILKCELPNEQIEYWEGCLKILKQEDDIKISLDNDQLILKGAYLKNTEYVLGVVIYTGHETKIMQNSKTPRNKHSKFMKIINQLLYSVMASQLLLCLVFAYFSLKWQKDHLQQYNYIIIRETNYIYAYLARVGTFLISYSQLIPISMYVGVEIIRLIQSTIIKYDDNVYDFEFKKPAVARTSGLPDELGQINFILSDKTGTLTKNNMILEKISIEEKIFSVEELITNFQNKYNYRIEETNSRDFFKMSTTDLSNEKKDSFKENLNTINKDEEYFNDNKSDEKINLDNNFIKCENFIIDFFRLSNICNSIVIDYSKSKDFEINYQSTSIDELSLIKASTDCGIILRDKTISKIEINYFNQYYETWEILATLPFDSDRKRMSIVVKSNTGEIYLFCKGADEVIFSKLNSNLSLVGNESGNGNGNGEINIDNSVNSHLSKAKEINEIFAKQGLRTLIMGKKKLQDDYFHKWFTDYNNILNEMNISHIEKQNKLNEMFESIEEKMIYIGCSAIEDKLQDKVEDTIELLKQADIRIWILTGDKIENSIEIAKSCNLIKNEKLIYFTLKNIKDFQEFDLNIERFKFDDENRYCLILDGKTLSYYEMLNENNKKIFVKIMTHSSSVICCRLTPKQKSQITKILKMTASKITLSVGDGANDVPMILEANIGVGISGREGTQAIRSADYSISQFKFLADIILVHGRLSYKRLSNYTCYAFYKNIIVVFTEIYFIIFTGFSGQIYFTDWFSNFFNTFWSSWPMIINFCMDRDLDRNSNIKYPKLYIAGPQGLYMNNKVFWGWILYAMFHGAIIFWVPMLTNHYGFSPDGKTKDHWWTSSLSFTILIHIVTIKLFITTEYWNALSIFGAISSLSCYYLCLYIFSIRKVASAMETKIPECFFNIFTDYKNIAFIVITPLIALIPDFLHKFLKKNYFLENTEIIKKIEKN